MNQNKSSLAIIAICLATFLVPGISTADIIVFSSDFESGIPGEISGPGTLSSVQGFAGIGNPGNTFNGNFLQNSSAPGQSTTLTLTNLPTHSHIDINFLLGVLESWDGGGSVPGAAPDLFNVRVDGATIFSESFETTNVSAQSYVPPPGVELVHKVQLGNWGHSFPESGYDMGLDPVFQNIAHTSDTLTIEWFANGAGWQGGNDESWALDNLSINLRGTGVPEPGTAGLLAFALCGATLSLRRKGRRINSR